LNELIQYMLLYASAAVLLPLLVLFVMRFAAGKIGHRVTVWILLLCAVRILLPTGMFGIYTLPVFVKENIIPKNEVVILEGENDSLQGDSEDISPLPVPDSQMGTEIQISQSDTSTDTKDKTLKLTFSPKRIPNLIMGIWIMGALIFMSVQLARQIPIFWRQKLQASMPNNAQLAVYQKSARRAGVKKPPKLLVLEEDSVPHLCGVFSPVIYMGKRPMTEEQSFYILSHELTHYKRKDTLAKVLLLLVQSVFWWNPVIYYFVRFTGQEIECACDEQVLVGRSGEERCAYGQTILQVLKGSRLKPVFLSADFGSFESKTTLQRFKMLLDTKKKRGGSVFLVLFLALFTASGILLGCAEQPSDSEELPMVFYLNVDQAKELSEEQLYLLAKDLPIPEKAGYMHSGWKVERIDGEEGDYSIRFEPMYEPSEYQITLVTNDGLEESRLLTFGEKLPTPIRKGYTFGGWYTDISLNKPIETVPADAVSLYAAWNEECAPGDFVFKKVRDGLAVQSYCGKNKEIIIPAYVGGMPVVALEAGAFAFMREITSVWLPETLTKVGAGAFRYCYSMQRVHLGGNVDVLDASVFEACHALKRIYYSGSKSEYERISRNLPENYEVIFARS